ncbi:hypothetical protein HAX54_051073 [Datura stramonium]|uniref:Uncharacterized protein n=1 Tax=Datura stramonium TaxID=4076 RepID=A0ABS8WLZ5_DATST|nr:hypothetical protein [Datura stramonium]
MHPSDKGPLITPTTTISEAIDVAHKRKKPSSSSSKGAEKSLGIVPFCSGTSKPPISLNGDGITSAACSSNERNVNQEQHRKGLKKKPKDVSNQHSEFADLDSKITRDSHQELLSTMKQLLHIANEENSRWTSTQESLEKSLHELKKELEAWTSKNKKITMLIEEDHRKKLSENQESITTTEDEINSIA